MTQRKYRRKQAKSQELIITTAVTVGALLAVMVASLPQAIILQAIIVLISMAILIGTAYYYYVYRRIVARREGLRRLQVDDVDHMSGVKFEDYVAELFRRQGYKIRNTPTSGDYGVDLIVVKDGVRTAVQTKRYSRPVNQAAVREVVAGMKHYKCAKSMVVTNNHFTRFAVNLANTNDCVLVNRTKLIEMIASR